MDKVLNFKQGRVPLLISMPHAGVRLTPAVEAGLIPAAKSLPDTDWHIPQLYDFAAELGASTLAAEYSRFVIDLNRPSDDKPARRRQGRAGQIRRGCRRDAAFWNEKSRKLVKVCGFFAN